MLMGPRNVARASVCRQASLRPMPAAVNRQRLAAPRAKRSDKPEPDQEAVKFEETGFDRETARLTVRMLTARAAGMVLQNVAQVDDYKARWLQEHFTKNPPIEGNAFLAHLMEAKPVHSMDPYTGATYYINPAQIAAAVLATRGALAAKLAKTLNSKVQDANIDIMRTHLERHTYVSGTSNETKPSYRHYCRNQAQQHHQHL